MILSLDDQHRAIVLQIVAAVLDRRIFPDSEDLDEFDTIFGFERDDYHTLDKAIRAVDIVYGEHLAMLRSAVNNLTGYPHHCGYLVSSYVNPSSLSEFEKRLFG